MLMIAAVMVMTAAACRQSPETVENLQYSTRLTSGRTNRTPAPVGGRISYDPKVRPVFVAPDGSRYLIASLLALPGKMAFGDFVWDDRAAGGGLGTSAKAEPVWIRVDLPRQLISVFRGADEIGTAVIVYGSDGKSTPSGIFPILGKERMHRSSLYDADMPDTLWLTRDGVAIHASTVELGRATHGCVGVPPDFARKLFAVASRGDTTVILPVGLDAKADADPAPHT
jgi:hypothetical protein